MLFIVATIATGFLAVWQWDRAHEAGGSFQNLGYALQWPLFGAFTIFLWIKLIRMDLAQHDGEGETGSAPETGTPEEHQETTPETAEQRRTRPLVPPPAPSVDADEDPELAEYNKYLAGLNESDQSAS
ncbi:DNA-binding transcriptional regulator of glucitol operon [Saccharopolyspora flava]|uniref:DNA-binding transcriptional regulator of glucitol operon n=1 Tax=Saccharopolyspora flava TaxID=95161 RepID=A0A1I6PGQ1_9PSEU|nr:DNA-binding transcriptional regulator of glucitol operon [Saccharopolyspora flava]